MMIPDSTIRSTAAHGRQRWVPARNWRLASLMLWVSVLCGIGVATAQDNAEVGREALSKKKYPWYDSENDTLKRIELGSRPEARSSNRNNIPLKPVYPPRKPSNWNWNFGWGWWNGLSVVSWILLGFLIAGLIAILVWAFLRRESLDDLADDMSVSRRSLADSIKQLPFDLETSTGDFKQQAQRAYADGDYRKAIVFLFSHVLVSLDQNGLIRLRKGKTNRQYLQELRLHQPLANYYQHVMVPFEATFFGDHELTQADFEDCWNALDGFQNGIVQTSQVANV